MSGFLKLLLSVMSVCVVFTHVSVSVSTLRLLLTSSVICIPYDWLKMFYSFYMTATVGIISMHGLIVEVRCRNQHNTSTLGLHNQLLSH